MLRADLSGKLLGQSFRRVDGHRIAVPRRSGCDGDLGERISRFVPLPAQAGDDPNGSIVLVQGRCELFARASELLLQIVAFEGQGVPFILESGEQCRDGRQRRRARSDDGSLRQGEEVVFGKGLAGARLGPILLDVLFDQALLEDGA